MRRSILAVLMAASMITAVPITSAAAADAEVVTISSSDTVATALELSRLTFRDGEAPKALLVRADLFADALAGGALAGDRPLLLTPSDRLRSDVAAELQRLGTTQVTVLGGPVAVGQRVLDQLADQGIRTTRLYGEDRIRTAVAIARRVRSEGSPTTALLARAHPAGGDPSQAFVDSMAAGAWAASSGWPVLLSATDELSDATARHLANAGYDRVILVGGEAALSARVASQVAALTDRVKRVAGATRYDTAAAIARQRSAAAGSAADHVVLVDGTAADGWAAGLAAASFGARHDAPVLLAEPDSLPPATRDVLVEAPVALAVCAAGASACTELEHLLDPPGIRCEQSFYYYGLDACRSTVAGLDVKFFPLPEGRRPQRLVMYFHGDGARDWFENWGFNLQILGWAQARDMLVLGIKAPTTNSRGEPAYGSAHADTAVPVGQTIDRFLSRNGVVEGQSLYWAASGGSWFLSGGFIPAVGQRLPGLFALSCGGSYPSDRDWTWDPASDTAARRQSALLFNYGDQDFLADASAASEQRYRERGFVTRTIVHQGAEHCRHPIAEPTLDFWEAQLG